MNKDVHTIKSVTVYVNVKVPGHAMKAAVVAV
jgi:hypothetical protein